MSSDCEDDFPMTAEGYLAAESWLKENGYWEKVSTTGFSVDGYSITETANYLRKRKKGVLA